MKNEKLKCERCGSTENVKTESVSKYEVEERIPRALCPKCRGKEEEYHQSKWDEY